MKQIIFFIFIMCLSTHVLAGEPDVTGDVTAADENTDKAFVGTFTLTSNYVFRGLSLTNNLPAFQGGFTYTFHTGIYLSVWGSNVDMIAANNDQATVELDTIIGIGNSIGTDFSYNVSFERYNYPKARYITYNEAIAIVTYKFFTATVAYTTNEYNTHVPGIYVNANISFDLPPKFVYLTDVNLSGGIGYYDIHHISGNDYADFNIMLVKTIKNYTLALQWTDTNHRATHNALDGYHIIAAVTAEF